MCKDCGCTEAGKPIKYECACEKDTCSCGSIIEFDSEPKSTPYCCGVPMKKI
jgi:hypothetical protein